MATICKDGPSSVNSDVRRPTLTWSFPTFLSVLNIYNLQMIKPNSPPSSSSFSSSGAASASSKDASPVSVSNNSSTLRRITLCSCRWSMYWFRFGSRCARMGSPKVRRILLNLSLLFRLTFLLEYSLMGYDDLFLPLYYVFWFPSFSSGLYWTKKRLEVVFDLGSDYQTSYEATFPTGMLSLFERSILRF